MPSSTTCPQPARHHAVRRGVRLVPLQVWLGVVALALVLLSLTGQALIRPPALPITGERVALVFGNAAYAGSPLVNSTNDARAIGDLLKNAGFDVDLVLDGTHKSMLGALQRLKGRVEDKRTRTVVFYYAGHAVQLDWHNFLIGVDANIRTIEDVPRQSLDLGEVLSLFSAANPNREKQFVVILDACRDNPFPQSVKLAKKGLSQFDAPPNTLVAFSTAPGQVAYDGEGEHSFYTGMLLREFAVPHVSLEDSLKRVRMGVRVASLGRQIPWESTSLEDRFYLYPPPAGTPANIESLEASIKDELESWLKVKQNKSINALVGFLQTFPNGNLSQLAQHSLDEMLLAQARDDADQIAQRVRHLEAQAGQEPSPSSSSATSSPVASAATAAPAAAPGQAEMVPAESPRAAPAQAAPAVTVASDAGHDVTPTPLEVALLETSSELGLPVAAPLDFLAQRPLIPASTVESAPTFAGAEPLGRNFSVGQRWTYRVANRLEGTTSARELRVTAVDHKAGSVEYNNGQFFSDLMGNATNTDRGTLDYPRQFYPATLQIGEKWTSAFMQSRPDGTHYTYRYEVRVVAKERVTVPAGTFETYRIEALGTNLQLGTRITRTLWVAPGINANVAIEVSAVTPFSVFEQNDRWELTHYAVE